MAGSNKSGTPLIGFGLSATLAVAAIAFFVMTLSKQDRQGWFISSVLTMGVIPLLFLTILCVVCLFIGFFTAGSINITQRTMKSSGFSPFTKALIGILLAVFALSIVWKFFLRLCCVPG